MPRNTRMSKMVAFKVEKDLAAFLAALPNQSEFIRRAVLAQFGMRCPLCGGSGVVPIGVGEHYGRVFAAHSRARCAGCRRAEPIPADLHSIGDADRVRWEQFFHGGPLYCANCSPVAASGDEPNGEPNGR